MNHTPDADLFATLWARPISRRRLITLAGGTVGAITTAQFLAACTGGDSNDATGQGAGGRPVDEQTALAAALSEESGVFDPTIADGIGTITVNNLIYEGLYRLDPYPPRTDVLPELAMELPQELSASRYRIQLREGTVFHDGSPLTADDVVFTIQRMLDPATNSLLTRFLSPIIAGAEAVGPTEVELELASPSTLLAERLAMVKVLSAAAVAASPDTLELKPVGSGPYQVKTASAERVSLIRFAGYQGDRELAYEVLDIHGVPDESARLTGVQSNRFQLIEEAPASAFESLSGTNGLTAESVPGYLPTIMFFNASKPPFNDARARQAALYAIDRDAITGASYFGQAEPAWSGMVRPDHPEFVEPDLVYRYDPDEARRLLAEAGHGSTPPRIAVLFPTDQGDFIPTYSGIVEEGLREAGFEPATEAIGISAIVSRASEGDFDLWMGAGDPTIFASDAEFLLRWFYYGFLPRGFSHWPEANVVAVEQLLDKALTTTSKETRRDALAEVQNIVQSEGPVALIHFRNQLTAWSSALTGVRALSGPGLPLDGVSG